VVADNGPTLEHIRRAIEAGTYRFSSHADEEAQEERIAVVEIKEAILRGTILENYPDHRRGPCCLLYGKASTSRDLHVVISTGVLPLTIVTVYEPMPPRWRNPTERGERS
jgi:hypothetical protein